MLRREPCRHHPDMNFSRRTSGERGWRCCARSRSDTVDPDHPHYRMGIDFARSRGMKAGASDFVTSRGRSADAADGADGAGLGASRAQPDDARSPATSWTPYDFGDLVGPDARMLRILQLVGRVAPTDASVLITGESGTGKGARRRGHSSERRRAGRPS